MLQTVINGNNIKQSQDNKFTTYSSSYVISSSKNKSVVNRQIHVCKGYTILISGGQSS